MAIGSASLPSWLPQVSAAKTGLEAADQFGSLAGTYLGGLANYLTKSEPTIDPETGTAKVDAAGKEELHRPTWAQAFKNSFLSQKDPEWRLSEAQKRAQISGSVANTERTWQEFNNTEKENKGKTADMPRLNKAIEGLKKDPNWTPEPFDPKNPGSGAFESEWGLKNWTKMQEDAQKADFNRRKTATAKVTASDNLAWENEFAVDPTVRAKVAGQNDAGRNVVAGWYVDANTGERIAPTPESQAAYNDWATANKKPTHGTPVSVQSAQERTKGAIDVEGVKQTGRLELDKQKAQERLDLEKAKEMPTPHVVTEGGKSFLIHGKIAIPLDKLSPEQKADVATQEQLIKTLQKHLSDNPEGADKRIQPDSYTRQLLNAKTRMHKIFQSQSPTTTSTPQASAAPTETKSNEAADLWQKYLNLLSKKQDNAATPPDER